jgi:hypothetical protein
MAQTSDYRMARRIAIAAGALRVDPWRFVNACPKPQMPGVDSAHPAFPAWVPLASTDLYVGIPAFFRPPPGRACDFLLSGQEKVTKEKATPRMRPSSIHGLRVRARTPGFADGASMHPRRTGAHPVRHPAGRSFIRSPHPRGPMGAHPARRTSEADCRRLLRPRPWMADSEAGLSGAVGSAAAAAPSARARRACSRPWMGRLNRQGLPI